MQLDVKTRRVRTKNSRRGIAVVEGAIVLSLILLLLIMALDMCLAMVRYNEMCRAAQKVARYSQVHGELSDTSEGKWGPAAYSGTAFDSSKYSSIARQSLLTTPHEQVQLEIQWLDGDCNELSAVRVVMRYTHQPLLPALWFNADLEFETVSNVQITY